MSEWKLIIPGQREEQVQSRAQLDHLLDLFMAVREEKPLASLQDIAKHLLRANKVRGRVRGLLCQCLCLELFQPARKVQQVDPSCLEVLPEYR